MSTIKIIIAIAIATGASFVIDTVFDVINFKGDTINLKKRLWLEWIGSFVFLTVVDLIMMLLGDSWKWYDTPINIGVCTVGILVDLMFLWIKRTLEKRTGQSS